MKITSVDSFVLTVPLPKPMALQWQHHKLVVAEIATDEGIRGLGYSLVFGGGGAEAVQVYLDTRLKPVLLGEDPLLVERLWERMFRADMGIKKQGVAAYALSALDIGLWDIAGKA
ncbi:MAG TPA: mandelate racemase/muconate lactonizing enzyme family protein, partial [Burkholderiales bacterium]|nr:mandelate racemase/muconate lactonizing enzyme family protein [Burkholderiales bacterium]